jgi:flagellar motor switch protein FliN/FliY
MTGVPATPPSDPGGYVQAWAESFAQVLSQIAGTPVPCVSLAEAPSEMPATAESDLWMVCTCSGALRGEGSFRLPAASAVRLSQKFTSEPEDREAALTQEHCEAVVEFLRQVAGLVVTALKPRWGEVQFHLDRAPGSPSWPPSSTFCLRPGEESPAPLLIELQLSAALAAGLRSDPSASPAAGNAPPTPAPSLEKKGSQLELLMDVELAMTLRFGGRRLSLREILEFCPGTVVELDRQVDEPVDLLLHGKLVARGEVVVVDGNYGLRVTEVVAAVS